LVKKIITIGIILFFLGVVINSSVAINTPLKTISNGNILYVGGTGEGNYTKIQDAIDDANDGNIVFVYAYSSPYYEYIVIDKSINLIGEDKNSTIIERNWKDHIINILAKNVLFTGFTVQDRPPILGVGEFCIYTNKDFVKIRGNIVKDKINGILAKNCKYTSIKNNTIISPNNDGTGILLENTQYCDVSYNNIEHNDIGIRVDEDNITSGTRISYNTISYNGVGLYLEGAYGAKERRVFRNNLNHNKKGFQLKHTRYNNIYYNNIMNSSIAINIWDYSCEYNYFYRNNIIGCKINIISDSHKDIWIQNFWNRPRIFPKPIIGKKIIWIDYPWFGIPRPCLMFDWRPAFKPYDIEV
jgi:hypothetical protein